MKISRTNTILYCENWAETVDFYRDIFKFWISHQNDWFVEFQITERSYLSVADVNRASIKSVEGQGITLAWQVEDIQAVHAELIETNITVTDIKNRWGAKVCYLHDPEKHRIELWQADIAIK